MTLPVLPSTLPKRTTTKRAPPGRCRAWHTSSDRRLVAPMTLVGFTALSVEMKKIFPPAVTARGARQPQRPENVVLRRFPGIVVLHERHVLVSSGVEHDRRLESGENRLHARRISHVADDGRNVRLFFRRQEFLLDAIQGVLVEFEQDQALRLEFCDLASELGADL